MVLENMYESDNVCSLVISTSLFGERMGGGVLATNDTPSCGTYPILSREAQVVAVPLRFNALSKVHPVVIR